MVLTAHFIDYGWKMHKRVLNFCVINNHSGNSIGKLIESCLIQWGIERVLTISVDNAATNKHAIDYVRKKMVNWSKKPVLGGKFLHVRYLAHILNLILRSRLTILDRSVGLIRNAVKYVRSSSSRLEVFKKCVEKEKMQSKKICVLDVPTKWNSTFIMLETALELKKAFYKMANKEDSKYESYFDEPKPEDNDGELEDGFVVVDPKTRKRIRPPNEHDWEKTAIFVQFLKVLYKVTLRVSASNKSTSHRAFHDIVSIQVEIEDLFDRDEEEFEHEAHRTLYQMAMKMKAKFTKYFDKLEDMNQLLLVALVLDPRYKLRNFGSICRDMLGYDGLQVKKASEELKELVVQLNDLYASSNEP
ncbi:zinc finger BED domain-containing protein RICESLEEPER 1-like [Rosa chinensis]|uniref:zinc finger BED domain-containing protein RICESLEEPER 1-like n=1 Tax=Rosa chinensis TaxID=74649 RepID=UPI000D08ADD1|nr:zinc finger BED domain-containing protein RICESLEEPER 1-like [Rosa chinensis]